MGPKDEEKKRTIITPDEGEHHHAHPHGHSHGHSHPPSSDTIDITIEENFMDRNKSLALENLQYLDAHGIHAINILGSVGSGKTSLIEAISQKLAHRRDEILVIAGDVTTTIDADRIAKHGVETIQVNTGVECHLDAKLIKKALDSVDLSSIKIIIIENVGNLICPADFPLGSHLRLVVVSVTEGPWMIQKHPVMFHEADILVINKIDLAEVMEVDVDQLERDAKQVNPNLKVFRTSIRNDNGVDEIIQHLGF
ncbi:MAG: hydrogenase nickel incorporation protein HypB [Candidatus Thorarchaeota archaeon]